MRVQACTGLLAAAAVALAGPSDYRVAAAKWGKDDNAAAPEDVDAADFDVDEDFTATPSLTELAKREKEQQKKLYEQDGGKDEQFVVDEEEPENPSEEKQAPEPEAPGEDEDDFDNPEDLEENEEDKGIKSDSTLSSETTSDNSEAPSEGPTKYDGQLVQTTDEEGTTLDTSALNRQEEHIAPTVTEYVTAKPTFKKEEEQKKKKKEESKEQQRKNNDIDVYDTEIKAFREAQDKNKTRFKEEVENAEKDLQAPKNPGWWRRVKHWYEQKMDALVDKYGSNTKD